MFLLWKKDKNEDIIGQLSMMKDCFADVVNHLNEKILVIADGAAFGAEMLEHPEDYNSKRQLNSAYLQEKISDKILFVMEGIDLT